MGALKRVGGFLAFLLVLTPCIIGGIYAGNLNTSSTLAGWAVGIGVFIIEMSLLVMVANIKEKKHLGWGFIGLLVGIVPAGIWIGGPLMTIRPFQVHLADYLAIASSNHPDAEANESQPVKGKMIPVDMKTKTIDPVLTDLSKDLRPARPEDVGTVAALWWDEHRIGHYGASGGGAYRWECRIMVWDKASGALLRVSRNFVGSDPPSSSNHGASQSGDKPYKEISEYLNGLGHQ
ncbi:MAG TPA: hypothetical protein VG649_09160 [Candidatus Angelobacter sp.]|jgi:hypothetical protein|nr:hypothetical protein [Candidatus Angelobacter sp.]